MHIYKKKPAETRTWRTRTAVPGFADRSLTTRARYPFAAAKIRLFGEPQYIFKVFFQTNPRADNFNQFHTTKATKSTPQYT